MNMGKRFANESHAASKKFLEEMIKLKNEDIEKFEKYRTAYNFSLYVQAKIGGKTDLANLLECPLAKKTYKEYRWKKVRSKCALLITPFLITILFVFACFIPVLEDKNEKETIKNANKISNTKYAKQNIYSDKNSNLEQKTIYALYAQDLSQILIIDLNDLEQIKKTQKQILHSKERAREVFQKTGYILFDNKIKKIENDVFNTSKKQTELQKYIDQLVVLGYSH